MKRIIIVLTWLMLMSCTPDINTITLSGVVKERNKSISNAHLIFLFWTKAKGELDGITYVKQECVTNGRGEYHVNYSGGNLIKINVGVSADGYEIFKKEIEPIKSKKVQIDIQLNQQKLNETVIYNLNTDSLFVAARHYELPNKVYKETWGLNVVNFETTHKIKESNIWLVDSISGLYLYTPKEGGISPIFSTDTLKSIFYEFTKGSNNSYVNKYRLRGGEIGFMLKISEDSYAKLVMSEGIYQKTEPFKGGSFQEKGIKFKVIYQPNGDNLYVNPIIDMEDYLLNY